MSYTDPFSNAPEDYSSQPATLWTTDPDEIEAAVRSKAWEAASSPGDVYVIQSHAPPPPVTARGLIRLLCPTGRRLLEKRYTRYWEEMDDLEKRWHWFKDGELVNDPWFGRYGDRYRNLIDKWGWVPNLHRYYTTNLALALRMVANGWLFEGVIGFVDSQTRRSHSVVTERSEETDSHGMPLWQKTSDTWIGPDPDSTRLLFASQYAVTRDSADPWLGDTAPGIGGEAEVEIYDPTPRAYYLSPQEDCIFRVGVAPPRHEAWGGSFRVVGSVPRHNPFAQKPGTAKLLCATQIIRHQYPTPRAPLDGGGSSDEYDPYEPPRPPDDPDGGYHEEFGLYSGRTEKAKPLARTSLGDRDRIGTTDWLRERPNLDPWI